MANASASPNATRSSRLARVSCRAGGRFARGVALATALVMGAAALASPAHAGEDDFEYAEALAGLGRSTGRPFFFTYARRVLEGMTKDPTSTAAKKDMATYGIARLAGHEAQGALARKSVPYKDLVKLFDDACNALEGFAQKNPNHAKATEAVLEVGTTRLNFVLFLRENLMGDSETMAERGTSAKEVAKDARAFVESAAKHFDKLRQGYNQKNATDIAMRAHFHWVLCQHYKALVEEPCSSAAMRQFLYAGEQLEAFSFDFDGTLVGVFAWDVYGLNFAEMAKCATGEEDRAKWYQSALNWFETCMNVSYESPEHLDIITRAFFNYARTCLEIRELGTTNYLREGARVVSTMLTRFPDAKRKHYGVRAWIELGKLHAAREVYEDAIGTLLEAAQMARDNSLFALEALANRELARVVDLAPGSTRIAPEISTRIGTARMTEERFSDAIAMYQQAIANTPRTRENVEALVDVWRRMATCYERLDDTLGQALCLDAIHELWIDGVAARSNSAEDPQLRRFGDMRWSSLGRWKALVDLTALPAFDQRFKDIRNAFRSDYEGHPSSEAGLWNEALDAYGQARQGRGPEAKKLYDRAAGMFREVSKNPKDANQDRAWTFLARILVYQDRWPEVLALVTEADAAWNTPEALAQAKEFDTIRSRREAARGELIYHAARAHVQKEEWPQVLALMEPWLANYLSWSKTSKGSNEFGMYMTALDMTTAGKIKNSDIEGAQEALRRLLRLDPEYPGLVRLAQLLAGYYNEQAILIEQEMKAAFERFRTIRPERTSQERAYAAKAGALNAMRQALASVEEQISLYEGAVKRGEDPALSVKVTQSMYETAKGRLAELTVLIPKSEAETKELGAQVAALAQEIDALSKRLEELRVALYPPRSKAADLYYELWAAQKSAATPTGTANVKVFGDLYRQTGLLKPTERQAWERARDLYEDFLSRKDGQEAERQDVMGLLGSIYYRLATLSEDAATRNGHVRAARERLQASVATLPENNAAAVGVLAGDWVAYDWRSPTGDRTWLLLPIVGTVAELKAAVQAMGSSPDGPPVMAHEKEADRNRHAALVQRFQQHVAGVYTDAQLGQLVASLGPAVGIKPGFWSLYCNAGKEFRLALAWVYLESGAAEDAPKARSLADSLTQSVSSYRLEEESEDWWLASVLGVKSRIMDAEARMRQEGASDRTKDLLQKASTFMVGLQLKYPQLGAPDRPQTLDELSELLGRLGQVRSEAGMPALDLVLERKDMQIIGGAPGAVSEEE